MAATKELDRADSAEIEPAGFKDWIKEAQLLRKTGERLLPKVEDWRYKVGDWWNTGETYGKRRSEGAEAIGIDYHTISAWATGSAALPSSLRRELPISVAKELARVPDEHIERYAELAQEKPVRFVRACVKEEFPKPRDTNKRGKPDDSNVDTHGRPILGDETAEGGPEFERSYQQISALTTMLVNADWPQEHRDKMAELYEDGAAAFRKEA